MYTVKCVFTSDNEDKARIVLCSNATSCIDAITQATEYGAEEIYEVRLSPVKEVINEADDTMDIYIVTCQTQDEKPLKYQMVLYADDFDKANKIAREQLTQGYGMELISLKKSNIYRVI